MSGYSGTPLIKKLGIKEGQRIAFLNEPENYPRTLGELPANTTLAARLSGMFDLIQVFAATRAGLQREFSGARKHLASNGALWISWPKKASGVKTDLDETVVREIGLALGLVDVKVCAVDEIWSGLKFVYRLKDR